jgi:(S)-ureidoglycine aminohydrolase
MNGTTRSRVTQQYALLTPDTFVYAPLPGWTASKITMHISPALGANFTQYSAWIEAGGSAGAPADGVERFVFVDLGEVVVELGGEKHKLAEGGYAFLPAGLPHSVVARQAARLDIFEKLYAPREGIGMPAPVVAREQAIAGGPFMGDEAAVLKLLLPDAPEYDMAVNIFSYQPGAHLPQVEIHIMEHGLRMLSGAGIYRLSDGWFPVEAGDVIWMAPYCPQWFVAMGKTPARYLYYKDVNRDPFISG